MLHNTEAATKRSGGLVIAIDGPSGAGKSTLANLLAQQLGYLQIDTGAMYRALALLINRGGIRLDDTAAVAEMCGRADIRLADNQGKQIVLANGEDVTRLIRTPEMSLLTSRVSALKPVRDAMLHAQRALGAAGGVVLEGRDIGTVVFPDADLKFFLSASVEERARRRHQELQEKGESVTFEETVGAVAQRDRQDSERDIAPLLKASDALEIDSSSLTIEQVLAIMVCAVKKNLTGRHL